MNEYPLPKRLHEINENDPETSHFGSNVQPFIEVTRFVAPLDDEKWTHTHRQHTFLMYRQLMQDQVKGFVNNHPRDRYCHALSLCQVNYLIADTFIKECNEWLNTPWSDDNDTPKLLEDIDYRSKLHDIMS